MITGVFIGFQGLYATLVCVACSQMEKLRMNLSRIGEGCVSVQQDSSEELGPVPGHEDLQQQLNDCIRHHQLIMKYVRIYVMTVGVHSDCSVQMK
jgi:hypothetical protein